MEKTNSRSIVLCFDGTNNEYGRKNTNVLRLYSLLVKNSSKQLVYYQSGLGTLEYHGLKAISKVLDLAFAHGLQRHVMDGYRFLMQNYRDGDKVSIFGFSRGAYTARVLASMVDRVGLLPPEHHAHMKKAWSCFKGFNEADCKDFKSRFSRNVEIVFMGLWDTVASVGIYGLELPFAQDNGGVKVVRHALSLDERRSKFQPSFFQKGDKSDVKEVWFAGCHSDVGGGAVDDTKQNLLSNNSFRWMINELFKCINDAQILFHMKKLRAELGYLQEKYEKAPTRGYLWLETFPENLFKQYGFEKLELSKREEEVYSYVQDEHNLRELFPPSRPPVKGCIYKLPAAGSFEGPSSKCVEEGYVFVQHGDNSPDSVPPRFLEEKHIRVRVVDKSHESLKDLKGESKYILLVRNTPLSFWRRLMRLCSTIGNFLLAFSKSALYIIFTALGFFMQPLLMLFFGLGKVFFYILKVIMFCFGYNPKRRGDTIDARTQAIDFWDKILSFFKEQDGYEESFALFDRFLGDSLSHAHDQLDHLYWWVVEFFPITHYLQQTEGNRFMTRLRMNRGKGRQIYSRVFQPDQSRVQTICVHESVRTRIETGTYKPRACFHITLEETRNDDPPVKEFKWDLPVNDASGLYEFDETHLVSNDPEGWGRIEWVK